MNCSASDLYPNWAALQWPTSVLNCSASSASVFCNNLHARPLCHWPIYEGWAALLETYWGCGSTPYRGLSAVLREVLSVGWRVIGPPWSIPPDVLLGAGWAIIIGSPIWGSDGDSSGLLNSSWRKRSGKAKLVLKQVSIRYDVWMEICMNGNTN